MAGDDATMEGVVGGKEQAPSHSLAGAFEGALRTVRHTAMRMVDADPESVEAQLRAGEIACLGCGAGLRTGASPAYRNHPQRGVAEVKSLLTRCGVALIP